ncbi:hypothetical protein ScPMuIL_017565 [Solemya velum]
MAALQTFIRSANFKRASKDDRHDMLQKEDDVVDGIKTANKLQLSDLKSAVDCLTKAVCYKDYPTDEDHYSHGKDMAKCAVEAISELMTFGVTEGRFQGDECQKLLLELTCICLSCGLGPVHLEMIKKIRNHDGFPDFVKRMDISDVKRLAEALQIHYTAPTDQGGMDAKDYSNDLKSLDGLIRELIEELPKKNIYTVSNMKELPKKNIYTNIKDLAVLKSQLKRASTLLLEESFPQNEQISKRMADDVDFLLKTIASNGFVEDLTEDIMSLLVQMCRRQDSKKYEEIIKKGYREYFDKFPIKQPNKKLFNIIAEGVVTALEECNHHHMLDIVMRYAIETLMKITEMQPCGQPWIRLTCAYLKSNSSYINGEARTPWSNKKMRKVFDLENHKEDIPRIMAIISAVEFPVVEFGEDEPEKDDKKRADNIKSFMNDFLCMLKNSKVLPAVMEPLVDYIIVCWDRRSDLQFEICEKCCERDYLILKSHPHLVNRILKKLLELLKDETYPWLRRTLHWIFPIAIEATVKAFKDGKQIPEEDNNLFIAILEELATKDFVNEDDGYSTVFKDMFHNLLNELTNAHKDSDTLERVGSIVPLLLKLSSHEEEQVNNSAIFALASFSTKSALLAPYLDELLDAYMANQNSSVGVAIFSVYGTNPEPLHNRLEEVFNFIQEGDATMKSTFLAIFQQVAKEVPKKFTPAMLQTLIDEDMDDVSSQSMSIMIMHYVSEVCPERVEKYFDVFMTLLKSTMAYYVIKLLANIAHFNEKYAKQTIETLMTVAQGTDETSVTASLSGLRALTEKYLDMIKQHKATIQKIQAGSSAGYVKDACVGLIDIIEGRSLAAVHDEVKQQQEDIEDLDERVDDAEVAVAGLVIQVDKHEDDIQEVKKDVAQVEERVEEVEEDLGETKVKVEEIDNKTMTNAPAWSRDLTKIMNPKEEHDWRLLAQRLGYSPDDIRHWATQSDPCMAMLSEWYATHKTSEATHAILKVLIEMDRMDGAAIVENAMKSVEGVVDDEPPEYETPPPIFLSYQWGHQNEAKMIRKHLQMAGYECWMDVGQMGGGDKLFEKIDEGIRAAKVVISCVTEKYAKSPNCNREVNLSVTLNKPLIPLLMEQIGWPPKGAMGPIFSEYLFIRFFQRGENGTKDERFWEPEKFQELLMQLNFQGILPDMGKIDKVYRNWWTPVTEEIVVDKDRNKKKAAASKVDPIEDKNKLSQNFVKVGIRGYDTLEDERNETYFVFDEIIMFCDYRMVVDV